MVRRKLLHLATPFLALGLVATACATKEKAGGAGAVPAPAASETPAARTAAADLRGTLTGLMTEHVFLASEATGAALRGDAKGYEAYAAALNGPTDSNTADLVAAVTSVYGDQTGKAFDGLWRSNGHIPAVVAYTQAVAKGDQAGAGKAVNDLLAYARTFGTTMHSVNANLPADAVEAAVKMHVTTLKAVIDAQKARDATATYTALRQAYGHMGETAAVIADATVKKFPEKFEGSTASNAATLQAGLTSLLREHVLLAASATGSALRGDDKGFKAAAAALNGPSNSNTVDVVAAVTSVYGGQTGKAFDGLWRSNGHIPAVVAYTQAVAKGDQAAADKAVNDLLAYARTFGTTMHSVNENLPADAVEGAIKMHATTLKAVVDDQKAGDAAKTAADLRAAVHHMSDTASVIAGATVKKFPEHFAG
jgi:hypothetical protein